MTVIHSKDLLLLLKESRNELQNIFTHKGNNLKKLSSNISKRTQQYYYENGIIQIKECYF